MPDIVDRLRDADRATIALYDWIFQDSIREIVRLRKVNAELLDVLRPFAETDLTAELVRDTFGFDVLRARAAIAKAAGKNQ